MKGNITSEVTTTRKNKILPYALPPKIKEIRVKCCTKLGFILICHTKLSFILIYYN